MAIKKKIISAVIVVLVFMALIIYFIILPTINDIKQISDTIYAERVDLEKKYLRGQLLKTTINEFEAVKPAQEKLTSVFIIEGKELEFITALEKIATLWGLDQNLVLQPVQAKSGFSYAQPLEIKVKGDFVKILRYLNDLEKTKYYFNITSLSLNNDNIGNNITADFQGNIFGLAIPKE